MTEPVTLDAASLSALKQIVCEDKKTKWWIGPLVTAAIVIIGFAVNWGVITTSLSSLKEESVRNQLAITSLTVRIQAIEIEVATQKATNTVVLSQLQKDIESIKNDIAFLAARNGKKTK